MKDVGSILMDIDTLNLFAIDIASQMGTLVYHEAAFPSAFGKIGEGSSKKAGADDEIIEMVHVST